MHQNWSWTPVDQQAADDLRAFLPARIFDIHAHLYRARDLNVQEDHLCRTGPSEASWQVWHDRVGRQLEKSRLEGGLFFPFPAVPETGIESANAFMLENLRENSGSRGLVLIHPRYPRENVQRYLESDRIAGFKVYHIYSDTQPTFEASIASFLPDWAWQYAHERQLVIMLHLVKSRALSDPDNQDYLVRMCREYPCARLVLAHAARGFHGLDTRRGLPGLRGLENVWFDTSAICEPEPLCAILDAFGPRRLLWGSDFPVSELRGKCVTVGDGFAWLQPDTVHWDKTGPGCQPMLVGLESLRALRQAADDVGLNESDIEDVFRNNARRLLDLDPITGTLTQDLYSRAKQRIPGGTQLLSKRPEMFAPGQWPAYFREARGCEAWDLDGRHYYDFSTNGLGSCLLGFRDPDVTRAVERRLHLGSMCSLNPPEEVALADELCRIHPWAEQARFARTGGEAMAMAVRIARATTKRSRVAICGYHGWHDWYLAANLGDDNKLEGHLLAGLYPAGVPAELRGTVMPFHYNAGDELQNILSTAGEHLAAVVMEPCRHCPPEPGFLKFVRDAAHQCGALLLFDEITMGWRLRFGGAHPAFGIEPDMAVFAKALGNGHPIAAVIGTQTAMSGAQHSFISSTYWTEAIGPAAALATIEKMRSLDVPAHVAQVGTRVLGYWREYGQRYGLPIVVGDGYPCLAHFHFEHELSGELGTLYTQLMLERGMLAGGSIYPTLAHTDEIIERYGRAVDEVFQHIAGALQAGKVKEQLKGPVAHKGFKRLT